MRIRSSLIGAIVGLVSQVRSAFAKPRELLGKLRATRPVGGTPRTKIDPKIVRLMQLQAGIKPGMSRTRRRELARVFAKKLTASARQSGATANMSRADVRRRQKAVASVVGNLVRA